MQLSRNCSVSTYHLSSWRGGIYVCSWQMQFLCRQSYRHRIDNIPTDHPYKINLYIHLNPFFGSSGARHWDPPRRPVFSCATSTSASSVFLRWISLIFGSLWGRDACSRLVQKLARCLSQFFGSSAVQDTETRRGGRCSFVSGIRVCHFMLGAIRYFRWSFRVLLCVKDYSAFVAIFTLI